MDLRGPYKEHKHTLKIDLHCHDYNSDVPDELWGRLLQLRETWITSEELFDCLRRNQTDVATITNHNNARFVDMLEKGHDILPGAEFTRFFEEYNLYLNVLAMALLLSKKKSSMIYVKTFLLSQLTVNKISRLFFPTRSTSTQRAKNHPLKLMRNWLSFRAFRGPNGQRDIWQNLLTVEWIRSLTPENRSA